MDSDSSSLNEKSIPITKSLAVSTTKIKIKQNFSGKGLKQAKKLWLKCISWMIWSNLSAATSLN